MKKKNKYFEIIYRGLVNNDNPRKIHKALLNEPVIDKYLLGFMIKLTNKACKSDDGIEFLVAGIYEMSLKAIKIINHEISKKAEREKIDTIDKFIEDSRKHNEWFYLASSHNDCAADHKAYQGRLYVDEKAPADVIEYAKNRGLYTVQWVLGSPAWFVTRPNCRHYFVSLSQRQVNNKTDKKLTKIHRTHSMEGHKELQTPRRIAIDEYKDRLRLLLGLYSVKKTDELKIKILKTKLLVEKWQNLK